MLAEIVVVAVLAALGTAIFYRFITEQGSKAWVAARVAKWGCVLGFTLLIAHFFGRPWSLLFPVGLFAVSLTVHASWCYRNGINPISAEPRERFLRLIGRGR